MLPSRTTQHQVFALVALLAFSIGLSTGVAQAQSEGQDDLDQAMVKRLDAKSKQQLEEVGKLLESAIKKGLDEENQGFAKQMLAGVALERAKEIMTRMSRQQRKADLLAMRDSALDNLEKAVENDPTLAEAHTMIAKLNMSGGGDLDRAKKAAQAAIDVLSDDPIEQSTAYMLRAMMEKDEETRLDNINKAIETNPESLEAFQARALHYFRSENVEEAVKDLKHVLELDPSNSRVTETTVQALAELDRTEEALKILNQGLAAKPSAALYRLRAAFHAQDDKEDEALSDLNKAIELLPNDPAALMARAEIYLRKNDVKKSRADLDKAMELKPGSVQGVLLRAYVSAEEGRLPDAINDMKLLVASFPDNASWANQLASFYQMDNRPRKAIEVTTDVLRREKNNWRALRIRADSRLSTGEHEEAVLDYENALKMEIDVPESKAGILNNLSWVLATSPKDELRDGKRSVELGEEAAELTKYEQAHILSTLAAAYAENGNFEKAIEWSEKAVKLGKDDDHEQLEQLQNELESYKNNKPWREEQDVEENKAPIFAPEDIIDT